MASYFLMHGILWVMEAMDKEALLTKEDFYHVQGQEMINMVRFLELMVDFLWRNDVKICRVYLVIYHAEGRMILLWNLRCMGQ